MKRQTPDGDNVFTSEYIKDLQHLIIWKQTIQLKNRQNIRTDFTKENIWIAKHTCREVQYHQSLGKSKLKPQWIITTSLLEYLTTTTTTILLVSIGCSRKPHALLIVTATFEKKLTVSLKFKYALIWFSKPTFTYLWEPTSSLW